MNHPQTASPARSPRLARLTIIAGFAALVLGVHTPIHAQVQGAAQDPVPALCQKLMAQGLKANNLAQWQAAILECQHQPPWLARLGHQLNQQGQYLEASKHLERSLMLDSANMDAQIDYAIALAGLGDKTSAVALLQDLLQNPELPAPLRTELALQQARLSAPDQPLTGSGQWQTRTQLSAIFGRDSNLLGAPNLDSLALTLGNTTQILPLENSYMAQAGSYHRSEAVFHARHQDSHGPQWDLLASLRQRGSTSVAQAKSSQYELIAERSTTHQSPDSRLPGHYLRLTLAGLTTPQSGDYTVQGLAAGWGQTSAADNTATCQWRAGAELQARHYDSNASLSGQYRGLSLSASCKKPYASSPAAQPFQWHASLRSGVDHPQDPQRAGGQQTQTALFVQVQAPAQMLWDQAQGIWRLSGEWASSQDQQAYSPLLQSGEPRKINKKAVRIEYNKNVFTHSSAQAWQMLAGIEWVEHTSNIQLFGLRSWGPLIGMRYAW